MTGFDWSEGNYSCDCNRQLYFGKKTNINFCIGSHRYIIIWTDNPDWALWELNESYPEDLLDKYL